jgi:hypothetical protein
MGSPPPSGGGDNLRSARQRKNDGQIIFNKRSWLGGPLPTPPEDFIIFPNADKDKLAILDYTKGKAGIYLWTNKLNGKNYVGSSAKHGVDKIIIIRINRS